MRVFSTHPCTFTHPKANKKDQGGEHPTPVIAKNKQKNDGYLRSGNVNFKIEIDSLGNAAGLKIEKFLRLKMADDKLLIDHIQEQTPLSKKVLNVNGKSYKELREELLIITKQESKQVSSEKIKQVFFPINDKDYHQLSILTPSQILYEMKERIEKIIFNNEAKEVKIEEKKNQQSEKRYFDIFSRVRIKYGGGKPQNISYLNSIHKGFSYLLPSTPPSLINRKIQLPRRDFFKVLDKNKKYYDYFSSLDKAFKDYKNNKEVRNRINMIIEYLFTSIKDTVYKIRQIGEVGWTEGINYNYLDKNQKYILDDMYRNEREEGFKIIDNFLKSISIWIARRYNYLFEKTSDIKMTDVEINHFYNVIKNKREELL